VTVKPGKPKPHAAPWRGRRRVAEPRTKLINVRCSERERSGIEQRAEQAGLSVGAYLRVQALGAPGPRAVRRPPIERKELGRLLGHLGKIGSNINQLAKRYNQIGMFPGYPEIAVMRREVGELRDALLKALDRGD
jgi:mobilization protein NikA